MKILFFSVKIMSTENMMLFDSLRQQLITIENDLRKMNSKLITIATTEFPEEKEGEEKLTLLKKLQELIDPEKEIDEE